MANTSAVCTSFKVLLMKGQMDFTASTGDSYKIAMFDSDATLSASTTDYSTSEEITNTSGTAYTAGGEALTNVTPVSSSTTAYTDFSDTSWTSASFTAPGCLIYNTDVLSGFTTNRSVCTIDFGGNKTVSSGTFTIQFPANDSSNAIIRITS